MKKIIYATLFALTVSFALSSCTEEEIKPKDTEFSNGGGTGDIGKL
jgi:hypothetical protein